VNNFNENNYIEKEDMKLEIEAASLIVSICSVIIAIFACIATIVTANYTKSHI